MAEREDPLVGFHFAVDLQGVVKGYFTECSGLAVEELNPFRAISVSPETESGRVAREHGPTLAVAVGLALRGFEDL